MRYLPLFVLLACCAPAETSAPLDSGAPAASDSGFAPAPEVPASAARVRAPAKPWEPVAGPDGGAADGVLAEEKIPCIREGGFGKRCPPNEKCVYDRAEDGTKGAAYCVDEHGEPTGNVPSFRGGRR